MNFGGGELMFFCMCMVKGRGDILFQVLNTSGAVRKNGRLEFWWAKEGGALFSDTE